MPTEPHGWFTPKYVCMYNKKRQYFWGYLWHFLLYLHISPCVQPVIKIKPGGIGIVSLSCNPQVKVADSCIQLICDGLILHHRPWQQSNQQSAVCLKCTGGSHFALSEILNSIYLCHRPFSHHFTHTTELAESFEPFRFYYRGIDIQIITHWVMATWELQNTYIHLCHNNLFV